MQVSARSSGRLGKVAAAVVLSIGSLTAFIRPALAADPVVFSFATVGDSRQDPANPDPTTRLGSTTGPLLTQDAIWLQNTKAWARIERTIQSQKPNLLFFNGDMIYGYGRAAIPSSWATTAPTTLAQVASSDIVQHLTQYAYWRGMVANLMEMGTYVVPVPGNHETQCSSGVAGNGIYNAGTNPAGCLSGKFAYIENEQAYVANMGDLVNDLKANTRFSNVSGVTATNVKGLIQSESAQPGGNNGTITTDQSDLTYSFDITAGGTLMHFAIINTDPSGADGIAPTDWLDADLNAAKIRGATRFFVFGHKPAYTYNYSADPTKPVAAGGLDATSTTLRDAFWAVIAKYDATYFCGHEHTVNVAQYPDPAKVSPAIPYQVIVGSGGSPFDDKMSGACPACTEPALAAPTDRYYAWALVSVHQSGAVSLQTYGFNDAFGATQLLSNIASIQ